MIEQLFKHYPKKIIYLEIDIFYIPYIYMNIYISLKYLYS